MKTMLIILALLVAGYLWYDHWTDARMADSPPVVTEPYFMEVRATNTLGGRDVEVAMFVRALSKRDCESGTKAGWASITKTCPSCTAEAPKCLEELPPRYARLFDDGPIPTAYLSATAASARERDLRVVVYGLTDREGMVICEAMRKELGKNFSGETHCVDPSGN